MGREVTPDLVLVLATIDRSKLEEPHSRRVMELLGDPAGMGQSLEILDLCDAWRQEDNLQYLESRR